jgi:hypothetical protein
MLPSRTVSDPEAPPGGTPRGAPPEEAAEGDLLQRRQEFFETFFKRGVEFTEELLRENERLRYRVLRLEEEVATWQRQSTDPEVQRLVNRVKELERERETLVTRFRTVEAQNRDFQERYSQIEREHSNLASLFVASHQLHSTFDLREVMQTIVEILINFVGAQTFVLYLLDETRGTLMPFVAEGAPPDSFPQLRLGESLVGQVAESGDVHIDPSLSSGQPAPPQQPLIVLPLAQSGRKVGAIAVLRLLAQKTELLDVDYELFRLLSNHAAAAILTASLALGQGPAALQPAELLASLDGELNS